MLAMLGGATLVAGGAIGAAFAAPDPSGPAKHGLCTAYFNGSANGRAHKHQAGPFVALEQAAHEYDDANGDQYSDVAQEVYRFCTLADNPKGIGGQPDDPFTAGDDGNGNNGRGKG